MGKGDLKVKRKSTEEVVTYDPRLSQDKKTFVLVVESTTRMSWFDAILACKIYAIDELDRLGKDISTNEH